MLIKQYYILNKCDKSTFYLCLRKLEKIWENLRNRLEKQQKILENFRKLEQFEKAIIFNLIMIFW